MSRLYTHVGITTACFTTMFNISRQCDTGDAIICGMVGGLLWPITIPALGFVAYGTREIRNLADKINVSHSNEKLDQSKEKDEEKNILLSRELLPPITLKRMI